MIKILNILDNLIHEQKRYKFEPNVYTKINTVVDKLWAGRNKIYDKKTKVDIIPFKTAAGVDGLVNVVINPRLPYIAVMGTKPGISFDPADIVIELNPKHYKSKKNLYLTLYHEMIHASDPTQTHSWSPRHMMTYDPSKDEKYWGHPVEFFAVTNEFLEGLIKEFIRRKKRIRKSENIKFLIKSFQNILNYFAKGESLSNLSLDILHRINDEYVDENRISELLANIRTDFPEVTELTLSKQEDIPYFLYYVELIKKFNPDIWPRFLTMLYKTKDEIQEILK